MKKSLLTGLILSAVVGGFSHILLAQNTAEPTVTIFANDPQASEAGSDTGTFTLRRAGSTNFPLAVFYQLGGTASNGVDYEQLGNSVQIPAGAWEASFIVKPINDSLVEGCETVTAQITGSPLACVTCGYLIGVPSNAVVVIADKDQGVNIYATDPDASEVHSAPNTDPPSDAAMFTVQRSGEINDGIVVYYELSGTASNGVDYVRLPGQLTIPAGASSAQIFVLPIEDNLVEGTETVVLTLLAPCPQCLFAHPPCLVPQGTNCYPIGPHNQAVANIHDSGAGPNDTNAPVVTIVAADPIAAEGPFCRSNWWWTTSWSGSDWVVAAAAGNPNSPAWRTNHCAGTNTAAFAVRRSGPTNSELTVYYAVGGTASNGVDYVTLPGRVTIPPGHRSARIEVIPIDDSIPERIETVVLGLQPPPVTTNGSPAYVTGFPSRAAAIIIDNDQPRPRCTRLPDGMFHVCGPATNGHSFRLRASPDLVNWTVLCTNTVTDGAVHFVDPDAVNFNRRFYQIVPEPSYTPQD